MNTLTSTGPLRFLPPLLSSSKGGVWVAAAALASSSAIWLTRRRQIHLARKSTEISARKNRLVIISGCDTGLGLSMAYWSARLGYKVIAGCYNDSGEGASLLRAENTGNDQLEVMRIDVTCEESLQSLRRKTEELLLATPGLELYAVIANAAVLICGEFFWQTREQSERTMRTNYFGATNLVRIFRHLLLQHKSRLILVTSDCSEVPLPGLADYSASKAALEIWARSLRTELAKYGVTVSSFRPGSFPTKSRLFSNQPQIYDEMKQGMSKRELDFYGEYFTRFNSYLIDEFCDGKAPPIAVLEDDTLKKHFNSVLEGDMTLTPIYDYSPLSSRIFHFLVKYLPISLSDKLLKSVFQNNAHWTPKEY